MQRAMAERVASGEPDRILVLEHDPVFTLGCHASVADIHRDAAFLEDAGIRIHRTDRGGQVTYHGPGQVVVYPVCDLKRGRLGVGHFVSRLEEAMIRTAADFGVAAARLPGAPGVWVGDRKLGAVGIHLRRWISTHGLAFNVEPELPPFGWITPCGMPDKGVCSLRSLLGDGAPSWERAADRLAIHVAEALGLDPLPPPPMSESVSATTWRRGARGPEVLVMLRQPLEGLWWSSVTGMVDAGESLEAAAIREVREETGLAGVLRPLGFVHCFFIDPRPLGIPVGEARFNRETCFHMEVAGESVVDLNPGEHSDYRWCTLDEAEALVRWDGAKEAIRRLRRVLSAQ